MRLRLRSFLLTSALTFTPSLIPSLAFATTITGPYVDGGAGYNLVQVQHVHTYGGGGEEEEGENHAAQSIIPPSNPCAQDYKNGALVGTGTCSLAGSSKYDSYRGGLAGLDGTIGGTGETIIEHGKPYYINGVLHQPTTVTGITGGTPVVQGKEYDIDSPDFGHNPSATDAIKARDLVGQPLPYQKTNPSQTNPYQYNYAPNPTGKLTPDEVEKLEAHAFGLGPAAQPLFCSNIEEGGGAVMSTGNTTVYCTPDANLNFPNYSLSEFGSPLGTPQAASTVYYVPFNGVETPFTAYKNGYTPDTVAGNPELDVNYPQGNIYTSQGNGDGLPYTQNFDSPSGYTFANGKSVKFAPYSYDKNTWNADNISSIYGPIHNTQYNQQQANEHDDNERSNLFVSPSMMSRATNNLSNSFSLRHSTGFTGFAAFGWGFGNGLRSEVEGVYNFSHINDGAAEIGGQNTGQSYGGFVNALYDIDLQRLFGLKSFVTPFLGVGGGYLWQRYNNVVTGATQGLAIYGINGGFAWQGIAGFAFDTGLRGLQITAQYRMIGQPSSFMDGDYHYGTNGIAKFDQKFNHQFALGLRYAFDTAPAPISSFPPPLSHVTRPVIAPAPVPARSYLVFFDWNQYALTSRARQIVVEAAHATSYVHTTRINVNGYTDSSAAPGPAGQKYNYALSVKRARSVEAELIRNGVPASEIVIRGYGDTNPLVPTAPNTREPQNRRVEIILHA